MSQTLPTTIPRGNNLLLRILIAVDDSEHSARKTSWRILPARCREAELREDDRLLWIAEPSE